MLNHSSNSKMAQLTVSFSLDNSAFDENSSPEISRIFQSISNDFKDDYFNGYSLPYMTNIRDLNGNKVGYLSITE